MVCDCAGGGVVRHHGEAVDLLFLLDLIHYVWVGSPRRHSTLSTCQFIHPTTLSIKKKNSVDMLANKAKVELSSERMHWRLTFVSPPIPTLTLVVYGTLGVLAHVALVCYFGGRADEVVGKKNGSYELERRESQAKDRRADGWTSGLSIQFKTMTTKKCMDVLQPHEQISYFNLLDSDVSSLESEEECVTELDPHSLLRKWVASSCNKIYVFIAITMLIVRNKHISIPEYWSTDSLMHAQTFFQIMSRDRYI
ncbi:hypothetical protein PR048_013187 [Dryococelus australis]|uniref:PiggyBac transposable element-derived protein domain-containing protein n=1 Tax=Dryococelus australis TaxID=614101 RepID=A0ABQ9HSZ1_9NEOP|nr:hypothetical protein PR048_013187 [Dryococelus australis]